MRLVHQGIVNMTVLALTLSLTGCKWEAAPEASTAAVVMPDDADHRSENSNSKLDTSFEGQPTHAKQTLESMLSLLDLPPSRLTSTEINALNTEANFRRDLLVAQSDLSQISASTVIATTSLAGNICKISVNKEKNGIKDLYRHLDFSVGPAANGKAKAMNTYLLMAERFWARKPSSEELALLNEQIETHWKSLSSTAQNQAVETERLAISICTGMLSAPESYIF